MIFRRAAVVSLALIGGVAIDGSTAARVHRGKRRALRKNTRKLSKGTGKGGKGADPEEMATRNTDLDPEEAPVVFETPAAPEGEDSIEDDAFGGGNVSGCSSGGVFVSQK